QTSTREDCGRKLHEVRGHPCFSLLFAFRLPSHTIVTVQKEKRNIEGFKIALLSNRSIPNPKGRNAKGRNGMKTIGRVFYSGIAH
ncbi:MAG: hypothetical protein ABR973_04940, partial [Candidatus Acidiferrales bacterium]